MRTDNQHPLRRAWPVVVVVSLLLLPVLVLVLTRAGRGYTPTQDFAIIDLRVRDVFSGDVPLVGIYSRYGWNHPGPLFLWLLAPLNRLAGGASWATMVGAGVMQGVLAALAAWIAWRLGGIRLLLTIASAIALTALAVGDRALLDPWNPYLALAGLPLLVVSAWGAASRRPWFLVATVVTGSFVVQTHAGYLPLVAGALAVVAVFAVLDRRERGWSTWRAPVVAAVGAGVALWLAPIIEQLGGSGGNLRALAAFSVRGADGTVGLGDGFGLLAAQYRPVPSWLGGGELTGAVFGEARPASLLWLLVPIVLLAAAFVLARRGQDLLATRGIVLLALLQVIGGLTLGRVTGLPLGYLFYWRIALAALTVTVGLWAITCNLAFLRAPAHSGGRDAPLVVRADATRDWTPPAIIGRLLAVATVALVAVVLSVELVRHPASSLPIEPVASDLASQAAAAADPQSQAIVRMADLPHLGLQSALIDELDRAGIETYVDQEAGFKYGDHRALPVSEADEVWYVAETSGMLDVLSDLPGARVVARHTPLDRAADGAATRDHRELAAQLLAAGRLDLVAQTLGSPFIEAGARAVPGIDPVLLRRVARSNLEVATSRSCRCGIVAFPADQAPDIPEPELGD